MTTITRWATVGISLALAATAAPATAHQLSGHQGSARQPATTRAAHYPAAGAKVPDRDPFYAAPKRLAKMKRGHVVAVRPTSASTYGSGNHAWQIAYRTTDTHLHPELTVTTIVVPDAAWAGTGARPIVSLQEPEDSLGTQCSPSYTIATGTDATGAALTSQLLQDGDALAIPDHEGPHSEFLAGPEEGHAVLDGIRAVNSLSGTHGLGKGRHPWGLTGYSGGANATAWAAQLMPSYAPHLHVVGAAIGGTPSNPIAVAKYLDGGATAGFEFGAAYAVALAYPKARIHQILNARGRTDFASLKGQCESDILANFAGRKLSQDTRPADPLAVPSVRKALRADATGRTAPTIPIFDYHANTDEIVPVAQDNALVKAWCARGATVDELRDPVGEHVEEAVLRAGTAATYLEDRFAKKPAPSTC